MKVYLKNGHNLNIIIGHTATKPTGVEVTAIKYNDYSIATKPNLLDLFYPIGSYYETSDSNFNPSESWGGTWTQDTSGQTLVSVDNDKFKNVGTDVGSDTITLTTNQIPSHLHTYEKHNTATNNVTLNITQIPSHSHTVEFTNNVWGQKIGYAYLTDFNDNITDANRVDIIGHNFTTSKVGGTQPHKHLITSITENTSTIGSGQPINIIQSSKVIIRWHRIA